MGCKRAHSALANGFYSVGVGAPRPTTTMPTATVPRSPSLRFLEHLTMEITVAPGCATLSRAKKQYAMTVHHTKTKASWRHCHSYDDYCALQGRLLTLMEQGHFCMAECPWLYTFLRRSFPKPPSLLASLGFMGNDKANEARRFGLLRTLATLQSVVLNPNNQSCDVLTNGVATELVAFLYGETIDQVNSAAAPSPVIARPWEIASPLADGVRGFSASLDEGEMPAKTEGEASPETPTEDSDVCCATCALEAEHSEAHVLAEWHTQRADPTKLTRRDRGSSNLTMGLSQCAETPLDSSPPGTPRSPPPQLYPDNAVLSPRRTYHVKEPRASKRFSLSASTVGLFHSLRQRVVSPSVEGTYAA